MENVLSYDDIVYQFLEIYYDGFVSRKSQAKVMPLKYDVIMLKRFFYENGMLLDSKNNFLKRCNEIITIDKKYSRIGELVFKKQYITSKR